MSGILVKTTAWLAAGVAVLLSGGCHIAGHGPELQFGPSTSRDTRVRDPNVRPGQEDGNSGLFRTSESSSSGGY